MQKHINKKFKIFIICSIFITIVFTLFFNKNIQNFVLSIKNYFDGNIQPREVYSFNADWQFALGEGTYDANSSYHHYCKILNNNDCVDAISNPNSSLYEEVTSLTNVTDSDNVYLNSFNAKNDSRFSDVSLPHTYNDIDSFNNYNEGISTLHGERSIYTGTAWYKKEFVITQEQIDNKKIYIEFEGARQAIEVYLNGILLNGDNDDEMYQNGFIPVGYDLSITDNESNPILVAGTNYLTVKVDNSYPYYAAGTSSALPWNDSHWHPNFGGLYRNVNIYFVDKLHLTLPLYSFLEGEGTYVYASNILLDQDNNTSATIHVDAQIENNTSITQTFDVVSKVYDKDGNFITGATSSVSNISLNTNEKTIAQISIPMTNVIRWSDDYPYLYTVKTYIMKDNQVIDNNEETIGVRTFKITSDAGFYLNGNYVQLNGWGQKSTMEWAGLGAAYPDWMTDYVIKMMKDANANYIRFGHTAGSPKQIEACDKYGILVTQPGVDGEGNYYVRDSSLDYNGSSYDLNSLKIRAEAFRDMLIYYRNNASIIMWEIANKGGVTNVINEATISSIKGFNTELTSANIYQILHEMVNDYDYGNRGTMDNSGTYDNTIEKNFRLTTLRESDTYSINYADVVETTIGGDIQTTKPLIEGEYNRMEAARRVWDKYTLNSINFKSSDYYKTGEEFSISLINGVEKETGQVTILNKTKTVGGANWIFSDSTSHGRSSSEVARVSGEVDAVMLPKDAYYVEQTIFDKEPSIHIIGHWNYSTGTIKNVYVSANNVSSVKLFLNGTEIANPTVSTKLWTFNNVEWQTGTLVAIGYNSSNVELVRHTIYTHGEPASIKITQVDQSPDGLLANGSDVLLLDVEVLDSTGKRCVTYDGIYENEKVYFTINDNDNTSIWRGGYNSSIQNSTNKKELYLEAGINRVAVKTTMIPGNITVTANTTINGIEYSDMITRTTTAISNTNGYTTLSTPVEYDLNSIQDPTTLIGDGSRFGLGYNIESSSTMITNLKYLGTSLPENQILTNFGIGSSMYSDETLTFVNIPRKLYNAEYLYLPNNDKTATNNNLINFKSKKNINVYVLHDINVTIPSWLSSYTLTSDNVLGGNGIIYQVYMKQLNINETISMGGSEEISGNGYSQIILFKEIDKVNNSTFFFEDFSIFDSESIYSTGGWKAFSDSINISFEPIITEGKTNLHFIDGDNAKLGYVQRTFSPIEGNLKLTFKAYLPGYFKTTNSFLRVWLSDGKIIDADTKDNVGVETYLYGESSGVMLKGVKSIKDDKTVELTSATSSLSYGEWHEFEIDVDIEKEEYIVKEVGSEFSQTYSFMRNNIEKLDTITIGTWKNGLSDFNVTDISINPIAKDLLSELSIDETEVTNFNYNSFQYSIFGLTPTSVLTYTEGSELESATYEYDAENTRIVLNVIDIYGNNYTYYFVNTDYIDLLQDFDIRKNPTTAENLSIQQEPFMGENTIHFTDTNGSGILWIEKNISDHTPKFKISYDAYIVKNNTSTNKFIRIWLVKNQNSYSTKINNASIMEYIDRNDSNTTFITKTEGASNSTSNNSFGSTLDTWYHFDINVDTTTSKYTVTLTNLTNPSDTHTYVKTFAYENLNINYLVFGTGNTATNDFYLKNINVENLYDDPLEGITIDNNSVPLNSNTKVSNYYSTNEFNDDTTILLTGESIINPSIVKDFANSKITITYTSTENIDFTYIVNYIKTDQAVTEEMLDNEIISLELLSRNDYLAYDYQIFHDRLAFIKSLSLNSLTDEELKQYYDELNLLESNLKLKTEHTKYLDNLTYSRALKNNYIVSDTLEVGNLIYKNGTDTFYSIPKRYLNADYYLFENEDLSDLGNELQFSGTAALPISVLIFRDIRAGSVTEEGYIFTGDIVTTTSGVVYKVYRKDYSANTEVILNIKALVNNKISSYNSIIAIKSSYEVENNKFYSMDFELYDTEYLVNAFNAYQGSTSDKFEIVTKDNENVLHILSNSTTTLPYGYFKFAKQSNKLKFNISTYLSDISSTTTDINRYVRYWFYKDGVPDPNANTEEKIPNVAIESYIEREKVGTTVSSSYSFLYRWNTNSTYNTNIIFNQNDWNLLNYDINVETKKFDFYTNNDVSNKVSNAPFYTNNFTYVNYFSLAGRKQGKTDIWHKDLDLEPVEFDYLSSININSNAVNNYSNITLDYLYESNDSNYNVQGILGTNGTDVNIGSIVTNDTTTLSYIPVEANTTLNHKVYFSKSYIDGESDYRLLLTVKIEEALSKKQDLYTISSWNNLQVACNDGISTINNLASSLEEIIEAYDNLCTALDNLALLTDIDIRYEYESNLYLGDDVNSSDSVDNPYITNNSAFTLKTNIIGNILGEIDVNDYTISRTLVSDVELPIGTIITMIDLSNSTPSYYYYEFLVSDNNINLNEFVSLDGTNTNYIDNWYYDVSTNELTDNLIFIVYYEEATSFLEDGSYNIKLDALTNFMYNGENKHISSEDNSYYISSNSPTYNMNISNINQVYNITDTISFNLTKNYTDFKLNDVSVVNTNFVNKNIGVIVSLHKGNTPVSLPEGTKICILENCYYTYDNYKIIIPINSDNSFMNLTFGDYELFESSNYKLRFQLFTSSGINPGDVIQTINSDIEINNDKKAAFKVTSSNLNDNIIRYGETKATTFNFQFDSNDIFVSKNIVVKMQRKDTDYVDLDLMDYISNDLNVYDSNIRSYILGDISNITFNFNNTLTKGTYRLVFELYDNDIYQNTEYQYIIVK